MYKRMGLRNKLMGMECWIYYIMNEHIGGIERHGPDIFLFMFYGVMRKGLRDTAVHRGRAQIAQDTKYEDFRFSKPILRMA